MHFQTIHLNITSSTSFMQDSIPLPIAIGMFYCSIVPLFFSQAGWYSLLHRAQEISPPLGGAGGGAQAGTSANPKPKTRLPCVALAKQGNPKQKTPPASTPAGFFILWNMFSPGALFLQFFNSLVQFNDIECEFFNLLKQKG
jgi:hypothetical protein